MIYSDDVRWVIIPSAYYSRIINNHSNHKLGQIWLVN